MYPSVSAVVEICSSPLGRGVFAATVLQEGNVVLRGWGARVPQRTRHSFQVDFDTHIEIHNEIEVINHSCEPNCGVLLYSGREVMEIVPLRKIRAGDELTTDYATFEYEIE